MPMTAIVASTTEGVIGDEQDMPWRLSSDLQRFKKLTMGGTLVMGRKTFDSIGRVLPGRQTVVLTRNEDWSFPAVETVSDPESIIQQSLSDRLFIVGGGEIYRLFLPHCDEIWWTRVWAKLSGDTRIDLPMHEFQVVSHMSVISTAKNQFPTDCVHAVRK